MAGIPCNGPKFILITPVKKRQILENVRMDINQNLYFLFFIIFFTELTPFQYIAVEKITSEKVNIELVDLRIPK